MTATRTSIPPTLYDAFLYAAVRVDPDGMPLTVLSFLARLNVDPWDEAAKLAQLPGDAARRGLAALIALLPEGATARLDAGTVAARLVDLLPTRTGSGSATAMAPPTGAAEDPAGGVGQGRWPTRRVLRMLVVYLLWVAFMLTSQWYFGVRQAGNAAAGPAISSPVDGAAPAASPGSR